eukprot:c16725_g2_i1.p1 GENE.c16725_g2_i1~~c16725_g2_i1.p1  ORF type:complete len:353 (+),score=93.61 c16725_g2_i1:42-1100(+)
MSPEEFLRGIILSQQKIFSFSLFSQKNIKNSISSITTILSYYLNFFLLLIKSGYLTRLIVIVIYFGLASYVNTLAAVLAGWRTPNLVVIRPADSIVKHRLPDITHDFLGHISLSKIFPQEFDAIFHPNSSLNDIILPTIGISMIVFVLLHPSRILIFRRGLLCFGTINMLRCISVSATTLPDASFVCAQQFGSIDGLYKSKTMFPRAFWRAIRVMSNPAGNVTCGDMIFSGHTVFFLIVGLTFYTYFQPKYCTSTLFRYLNSITNGWFLFSLRWSFYISITIALYIIIASNLHYTIDVLLATIITFSFWWTIHAFCTVKELREKSKFFSWLESDTTHQIDIKLDKSIADKCH